MQKGMVINMFHRNYQFRQYHDSCYPSGKPFMIEIPHPGKYKVIITLKTEFSLNKVWIYTGAGNLAFTGSIPAGIFKQTAVVNVGNSVHDDERRICQDREITVTVIAEADCFSGLSVSEISCPAIYIAGTADDTAESVHRSAIEPSERITRSTAKAVTKLSPEAMPITPEINNQSENQFSAYLPENCYNSWKQMLTAYTDHTIAISDYSHPGLTTESFQTKGLYAAIKEYSRPGDFYFFQFDPSSQLMEDWTSGGTCRRQLARYIIECRDRFVYPVLLTPAACHNGKDANNLSDQLWEQCLDAYREVGKMTVTPVIELHKLRVTAYDAYITAGLVAKEIARVCGAYSERGYRFLAKCMR